MLILPKNSVMKSIISLLLGLLSLIGVGKCGNPKEEPILESLVGTTWNIDQYVTAEKYPYVPEKYIGEPTLYYEFVSVTTVKRFSFAYSYITSDGVRHDYDYRGYDESTHTYTLNGNKVVILPEKDGKAEGSSFTVVSPTEMTHASGMRYLRK